MLKFLIKRLWPEDITQMEGPRRLISPLHAHRRYKFKIFRGTTHGGCNMVCLLMTEHKLKAFKSTKPVRIIKAY